MMNYADIELSMLNDLPQGYKLIVSFFGVRQTIDTFGSTGRNGVMGMPDEPTDTTKPMLIPLWHCSIEKTVVCDRYATHSILFFRGHGHNAKEAITEAFACMNKFYQETGQPR